MDVQAATSSYDCKTPGCTGEASAARGRGVYCRSCRARRYGGGYGGDGNAQTAPQQEPDGDAGSTPAASTPGFEQRARRLVALGRDADHALRRFNDQKARALRLKPDAETAVRAFREAARDLLATRSLPGE